MTCSRKIIDTIKVIAKIENFEANNALTFDPTSGILQFGGPLVKDTVVNGNFNLSFGSFASNIKYFSVSSNTTVYLEANNGAVGSFINIENSKILIGSSSPTSGGLMGLHDYSAGQNDGRYYAQRIFVDNHIVGKSASTDVTNPGPTQNGQTIAWNNPSGMWVMQAAGAAPTAGADTQVIHNIGGTLVGHPNFTFTPVTNFLSVPSISLGHASLDGIYRHLYAQGVEASISIVITPKTTGSVVLAVNTGAILLGAETSPNTVQRLMARGAGSQVDIALETKGPDAIVFIGDKDEVGSYRIVQSRGYNANVDLFLRSKGEGNVVIDPDSDAAGAGGRIKLGHGSAFAPGIRTRQLFASSDYVTTNLEIGGDGDSNFTLLIGTSDQTVSTRTLTVGSAAADCNLNIIGKGQGLVAVNGIVRSKKIAIVNWNMDNTTGFTVAHGFDINSWKKIVSVDVVIRNDVEGSYGPLDRKSVGGTSVVQGGVSGWDSATVALVRLTGGDFDNTNFDSLGGYVRGWIYINYEL